MRWRAWMLARIIILVTSIAMVSATAQELHVSHQFHAQDDNRGRAAPIFATEAARRSPELKIVIPPQLLMASPVMSSLRYIGLHPYWPSLCPVSRSLRA